MPALSGFPRRRLSEDGELALAINSTDQDLNDFLSDDASNYQKELLAVTYLFADEKGIVAYYSVSNDKISHSDIPTENGPKRRLLKKLWELPHHKRGLKSFPAVKIGRLAVDQAHAGKGIGAEILDYIKADFTLENKTGCRFITVDAYNNPRTIDFYKKNGFFFLRENDNKEERTRLMYFDLKPFRIAIRDQQGQDSS